MEFLKILGILALRVIILFLSSLKRFGQWWVAKFRAQAGTRKLVFGFGSLMISCCLCMCLVTVFSPGGGGDSSGQEVAATEVGRGDEIAIVEEAEPRVAPTKELVTDTPEPTETAVASNTPEPTNTIRPTNTPRPTNSPVPTDTPSPAPSQVSAATQPPAATQVPVATEGPPTNTPEQVPTLPPPTNTPVPEPTQPPPTEPPASSDVNIIRVNKQDEYVDIRNDGGAAQDLGGWVLVSERGNQQCPLGGVIDVGVTLRIWALAEDSGNGGFNCGFGSPIWNNSEPDPAVLYDNNGVEVSRFNS